MRRLRAEHWSVEALPRAVTETRDRAMKKREGGRMMIYRSYLEWVTRDVGMRHARSEVSRAG